MRFNWMSRLAAQIPPNWGCSLDPMMPGETLLGPLPAELAMPFRVVCWANERSDALLEAHLAEDSELGSGRAECRSTEVDVKELKHRCEVMNFAVIIGIREAYQLAYSADVLVRYEGVVVAERKGHTPAVSTHRS